MAEARRDGNERHGAERERGLAVGLKTKKQLDECRGRLAVLIDTPGLSPMQMATLRGMLCGVVWAAGGAATSTLDRIMAGEPIVGAKCEN